MKSGPMTTKIAGRCSGKTASRCLGFTLVELLIVIAIIGVLVGILIPVVSSVRNNAKDADTRNTIQQLSSAIERYFQDFRAYPGPLSNTQVESGTGSLTVTVSPGVASGTFVSPGSISLANVTMAENLTLGLLGGLRVDSGNVVYDPSVVGQGPANLNPLRPGRSTPYFAEGNLSWRTALPRWGESFAGKTGQYADLVGQATDTVIPEFLDRGATPMPILYLRPRTGSSTATVATSSASDNPVIVTDGNVNSRAAYSTGQYEAYLNNDTGEDTQGWRPGSSDPKHGLRPSQWANTTSGPTGTVTHWNPFAYFSNPNASANEARNKDGFILISAGRDRRYGTNDDITNFGRLGR